MYDLSMFWCATKKTTRFQALRPPFFFEKWSRSWPCLWRRRSVCSDEFMNEISRVVELVDSENETYKLYDTACFILNKTLLFWKCLKCVAGWNCLIAEITHTPVFLHPFGLGLIRDILVKTTATVNQFWIYQNWKLESVRSWFVSNHGCIYKTGSYPTNKKYKSI